MSVCALLVNAVLPETMTVNCILFMSKAFPFHHGLTATGYVQSPTTDAQLPATTVSASFTSQQYLEKSLPNWTLHMKCL